MHFAIAIERGFLAESMSTSQVQRQLLVPGITCVTPVGVLGLLGVPGFGWFSFMNKNLFL